MAVCIVKRPRSDHEFSHTLLLRNSVGTYCSTLQSHGRAHLEKANVADPFSGSTAIAVSLAAVAASQALAGRITLHKAEQAELAASEFV